MKSENFNEEKRLIIYFSRADENYAVGYIEKGNTEIIAEYIREFTNADMLKIERKIPYAKDYQTCIEEAKKEIENRERPEIIKMLTNIEEYNTIYIGGPVYWGVLPQPMVTQLEALNWNGKVIKPFTTHEGSGLGGVIEELTELCVGAKIQKGLAIRGSSVKNARNIVKEWIEENEQL